VSFIVFLVLAGMTFSRFAWSNKVKAALMGSADPAEKVSGTNSSPSSFRKVVPETGDFEFDDENNEHEGTDISDDFKII
jgi:hypothetical protein